MPDTSIAPIQADDPFLSERAERIRTLGKRAKADLIEIGRLLDECKARCGHGNWLPWLEREFGWSQDTAERFMSLHRLQGQIPQIAEYDNIPVSGLYLLARPSTSESACDEVIARAESGERLRLYEVRAIIAAHPRDAVLKAATALRAETLQARDGARKADFERPVTVSLASGLFHGDFRVLADQIESNSVDLVLTDPPYHDPSIYGEAARIAARILKPGGSFIAYTGQTYHHAALDACDPHLRHWYTLTITHSGGSNLLNKIGVRCGCKFALWYVKDTRADPGSIIFDPIIGGGREKELHPWQQAVGEAQYLIEKLTSPDGLVVDFFAGSGTTAVAAKAIGRRWIGFEIDPAIAERASRRITAADSEPLAADAESNPTFREAAE
jgi:DNA modification methylase